MKVCTKCHKEKSLDEFAFHRTRLYYEARCKSCARQARRLFYQENLEKERSVSKARARTKSKFSAERTCYRCKNPFFKENGRGNLCSACQYRNKLDDNRYRQIMRRNFNLKIDKKLTKQYINILALDLCSYCGKEATSIDHIVPISKGGSNDWTNLTAACLSCNTSKSNTHLLQFLLRT